MKPAPLTVRSPDPVFHADAIIELCARTFGRYARMREDSAEWYFRHSHYDWGASAVGFVGDDLVAHWGIWGYGMRVGRAVVRCGGVGAVATVPSQRGRGVMARTAPHSLARMRASGYHLSLLFGIDHFYQRFGYVSAWREACWHLRLADLPAALPRVAGLRRVPVAPTPALVRLHNRWNAGLTGTAVRPTYARCWSGMKPGVEAWCWGAPGRPAGHVLVQAEPTTLVCSEATGAPDAVLAVLARLCRRKSLPQLRFDTLPDRSALAGRLRRINCKYEQQLAPFGGVMVRLIDLAGCLEAMEGELSARLARSELDGYRGALALHGPEGDAVLALDRGRVTVSAEGRRAARSVVRRPARSAVRGGWALAQLLLGVAAPDEICEAGRLRLTGDAARLVRALFPAQHPELHRADRF